MIRYQFRLSDTTRRDYMPNANDATKFLKDLTLGAGAAVVAKTIIAPIERVKLILQVYLEVTLNYWDAGFGSYNCICIGSQLSKH